MHALTIQIHMDPVIESGNQLTDVTWWADSPDVEGWTAGASSLDELRESAVEGLKFFLDLTDVEVRYELVTFESDTAGDFPETSSGPQEAKISEGQRTAQVTRGSELVDA